jgi:hypothetical protein
VDGELESELAMPGTHSHRGPDPEDEKLFAPGVWPVLRSATSDLCWLLSRGYAVTSAVELVGNRYSLARRQRLAIARCACSDEALQRRRNHQVPPEALRGKDLWLDGFNVLIALEAALGGGTILRGRDDSYRDLANVYSRYREVEETDPALQMIGKHVQESGVRRCCWWLDQPVSNSGRFRGVLLAAAECGGWDWQVELVFNPDKVLAESDQIVATSDSVILDHCHQWFNLAGNVIRHAAPNARVVDLSLGSAAA